MAAGALYRDSGAPPPTAINRLWFAWCAVWGCSVTALCSIAQIINHRFNPSPQTFKKWATRWGRSALWGMGVRADYTEEVPLEPGRPYVFVANHQNMVDILVLSKALPYAFGFAAKAELRNVPFMGLAMRHSPCLFLDKSTPRRAVESLREAGERIRAGTSVLVFPEGERSYGPDMLPFQKGAFSLALEAGVPLAPIAILNAYEVFDERHYTARPGTVIVRTGAPIPTDGLRRNDAPALADTVRERIQGLLDRAKERNSTGAHP